MTKFTKEVINVMIRWCFFIAVSCIVFVITSVAFGFIQELSGLDVRNILWYFIGLTTSELIERISKIGEKE
jgi:hypothetical protein